MSPQGNSSRKSRFFSGHAIVLALAFLTVLGTPGVALGATGSISGTVTAASGGTSLQGIEVCAWEVPSENFTCTATDALGEYTISALPVGNYKVEFWPGSTGHYIVQFYNSKSSWQEAELVAVTSGADSPGINAALKDGGQITGTVTDATSGAGIQSSTVCAVEVTTGEIWNCVLTHNNGQYTLGGLPSGSYKAWFSPDVEGEEEDDYFQQFYNGKPTFAQATAIPVAAPGVVSGVDARLVSRKVIPPPPVVTLPAAPVVPPVAAVPKPKPKPMPKPKHCSKGQKSVTRKGKKRCVKVHREHRHGRHAGAKRMAQRLPPLLP